MSSHKWTVREHTECIYFVINEYVIKRSTLPIRQAIVKINKLCPNLKYKSISARISNIRYTLEKHNVSNTIRVGSLSGASKKQEVLTLMILDENNIKYN